jgi:hypothetical protein
MFRLLKVVHKGMSLLTYSPWVYCARQAFFRELALPVVPHDKYDQAVDIAWRTVQVLQGSTFLS